MFRDYKGLEANFPKHWNREFEPRIRESFVRNREYFQAQQGIMDYRKIGS